MEEAKPEPRVFRINARIIYQGEHVYEQIKFVVFAENMIEAIEESEKYLKSFQLGEILAIKDLGEPVNVNNENT